ncbi:MAG: iron ABC transporter permease [Rhizobacter sp.]|nr:iron ABC transporter permease [Chlorobiales bacterium]
MLIRRPLLIAINLIVLAVLFGYVFYPALSSFINSFHIGSRPLAPFGFVDLFISGAATLSNYNVVFTSPSGVQSLVNTLLLSVASVITSGVSGVLLAFAFWRFTFPFKRVLSRLFLLPLGLPPIVGVYSFQYLYAESGFLPQLLQHALGLSEPPFSFTGFFAVLLVHTYSFYVHFFLFSYAAFSRVDYSLLEAAENLGAGKVRTFFKVLLPQISASLYSAALIVFILSTASFTAPLIFADRMPFITTEIYNQKIGGNFGAANALSVVLVAVSMGLLYLFERWNGRRNPPRSLAGRGAARGVPSESGIARWMFLVPFALWFLFVMLPVLTLLVVSLADLSPSSISVLPERYTLGNYIKIFTTENFYTPFLNSLTMATLSSIPNLIFGAMAGVLLVQRKIYARTAISILLLLPLAVPGTALAMNLLSAFTKPSVLTLGVPLANTYAILPLAYFIRNIPYITRSVSSVLNIFDYSLTEAASNLGASGTNVVRRVVLPIILAAVTSGFLFTFINALGEFVSSIVLYSAFNRPISVDIFSEQRDFNMGVAAAQGILLMLLVFAITSLVSFIFRSQSKLSEFDF